MIAILLSVLFATLTWLMIVARAKILSLREELTAADETIKRLMNEKVTLECEKAALEKKLSKYDHRNRRRNEKGLFVK